MISSARVRPLHGPTVLPRLRAICGSTSTTAVSPARRIAGAAAASRRAACGATARGASVFATSCARWRPRRRSSGAGPSSSASVIPAFSSSSARSDRLELRAADDDADEVAVRRVAERRGGARAPPSRKRADVVARRVRDRARVGLERLHEHAAGRVAAAAAGELGDQLERALLRAEVRHRERRVGVDHRGELDAGEVVALRDHLRAEQHCAPRRRRSGAAQRRAARASRPRPRRAGSAPAPGSSRASSRSSFCVPAPSRASSGEPHAGQFDGDVRRVAAVVAAQRRVAVQHERDVAVRAADRRAARAAVQRRRDAAAVQQQDRLAAPLGDAAQRVEQRRRERVARLAPQVDRRSPAAASRRSGRRARAARAPPSSRAAASPSRRRRPRLRATRASPRPCARRSAGRSPACTTSRAPRRRRSARARAPARRPPSARRRRCAPRRSRSARARRAARPR